MYNVNEKTADIPTKRNRGDRMNHKQADAQAEIDAPFNQMLRQTSTDVWFFDFRTTNLKLALCHSEWLKLGELPENGFENVPESLFETGFVVEASRAPLWALFRSMRDNIENDSCAIQVVDRKGRAHWLHVSYMLVFDAHGKPEGAFVLTQTTDARKDIELTLVRLHNLTCHMRSGRLASFEANLTTDELFVCEGNWLDASGLSSYSDLEDAITRRMRCIEQRARGLRKLSSAALVRVFNEGGQDVRLEFNGKPTNSEGSEWVSLSVFMSKAQVSGEICALIYVNDMDPRRRAELELQQKAESDPLTGLYNRSAIVPRISKALAKSKGALCAMYMIDLDDFKGINDTFGHMYGDAVLSEMASHLQRIFRRTDLIGRMGGDEFIVFLADIPSEEFAMQRAELICSSMQATHMLQGEERAISGSVGLAYAPQHGTTFDELYAHSDDAMYHAKNHGKNKYCVYRQGLDKQAPMMMTATGIEYYLSKSFRENMPEYVFQILYHADDLQLAIEAVLQLFAKHYDTQHAFTYEFDHDLGVYRLKSDWYAPGTEPIGGSWAREMTEPEFEAYQARFATDGIYHVADIHGMEDDAFVATPGARAALQGAFRSKDGECFGFFSLEEYRDSRVLTSDEHDTLKSLTEIIGTFMQAKSNQARSERQSATLRAVMDSMMDAVYVIDPVEKVLVFANRVVEQLAPDVEPGKKCYEAIMHQDGPCAVCVGDMLDPMNLESTARQEYLFKGRWMQTDANWIEWPNGKRYALISSHDVTDLKNQ